jgi:tryptophan synthase alpha chain
MTESPIEAAFAEPALVPYVVGGDPSPDRTAEYVAALDRGGADVIELGLPFSEPIADGPTIQSGIVRALDAGMTPERYLDLVRDLDTDAPLVCMTYYNLIYQYGRRAAGGGDTSDAGRNVGPFVADAAAAGIDGLIVPDLPAEEAGPLRAACDAHGCDLVFIVAPTTRGERLERMRECVSGFVYVQARLGTTGAREDVSTQTYESLDRVRDWGVPKAVGFGVSGHDQARAITAAGADGVVAGSVFVDAVADAVDAGDPAAAADDLEAIAREIKEGAVAGAAEREERPGAPEPDAGG